MKRLALVVLCLAGFSTSVYAEKLRCVDKQKKEHIVEFVQDNIDFVYVDGVEYTHTGKDDSVHIKFENGNKMMTFIVNSKLPEWFFISHTKVKNKKTVEVFYALCDNVNLIEEDSQPQFVINK